MMAQWHSCKQDANDALLLFRLGDFYESFYEDAQKISKEIGLTLTARQGVPMCGLPCHTADTYIDRLIAKGFKVAIAEQEEAPETKGLMKRNIARIITPATCVGSQLLSDKQPSFFASLSQVGSMYGLTLLDLTTSTLYSVEFEHIEALADELCRAQPKELLSSHSFHTQHLSLLQELSYRFPYLLHLKEESYFDLALANRALYVTSDCPREDEKYKLELREGHVAAVLSSGTLLRYLQEDLKITLPPLSWTGAMDRNTFVAIDRATLRHLELIESLSDRSSQHTLLHFLDHTVTSMGGRLLREWIQHPLTSLPEIFARQESISLLLAHPQANTAIRAHLAEIRDLERLIVKLSIGTKTARDLLALGRSLTHLPALKAAIHTLPLKSDSLFMRYQAQLADLSSLAHNIVHSLVENPPPKLGDGELFRSGVHLELDRLRSLAKESLQWIARYQADLREESGIKTLKVGFTRAFGYYIEVSAGQKDKVPASFQRRQTLTHAERFTTDALKQFEYQVLTAEERSLALESELFDALRKEALLARDAISRTARAIACIDLLTALAHVAKKEELIRPTLDLSTTLHIERGRHPIVANILGRAHFIANDTTLSPPTSQLMLITGPNMAGKSTYLRQVALLVILAQMGSFVPAKTMHVGIVDRIFSRIGASDNLARGHSTFMVEMQETAHILKEATSRSLILLDEIGRGTSTYDGIAIAWAVAEFLLTTEGKKAKTLFATHYWELTHLEKKMEGAVNYQVAIQDTESGVLFLRKIIPGSSHKSYGIHVAKLAGLPMKAVQRAEEILAQLEESERSDVRTEKTKRTKKNDLQLPLFVNPLVEK